MIWLLIVLFGVLSVLFLMGKGSFLIAGYNTASPQEKAIYDEKKLCRVMGVGMSVITLSLLMGMLNENLASYFILGGSIIGLIIIFVGSHKYAKEKDNKIMEAYNEKKECYKNSYFYTSKHPMLIFNRIIFQFIKHRFLISKIAIVIIIGLVISMFTSSVSIEFNDHSFTAKSFMASSITVEYKDINDVQYQQDVKLGSRTWGVGSFKIQAGHFKNDEFGQYQLYSYVNCHDYVVLKTKDSYIVLNDVDEEQTKIIYEKILDLIQ